MISPKGTQRTPSFSLPLVWRAGVGGAQAPSSTRDHTMRSALIVSSLLALLAAPGCAPMPLARVGHPGWVRTEQGCYLWSDNPFPAMSVSWTGTCENGRASGRGTATWRKAGKEIIKYDVAMKDGRAEGAGSYVTTKGFRYDGNFTAGKANGRGVLVLANDGTFDGEFSSDDFVSGTFSMPNGTRYDGAFVNNTFEGPATFITPDGDRIEGQFHIGKLNGLVRTDAHGKKCVAWYKNNLRNGHATCTWPNGIVMDLNYVDGKANGPAIMAAPNGNRYEGELHNFRRDGHGAFWWANGDHYDGSWSNGLPNGQGTLQTRYETFAGIWKNGCFSDGRRIKALVVKDSACHG
jgi:hypothetical protein